MSDQISEALIIKQIRRGPGVMNKLPFLHKCWRKSSLKVVLVPTPMYSDLLCIVKRPNAHHKDMQIPLGELIDI